MTGAATAAAVASRGQRVVLIDKEDGPAREGSGRAQGSLRLQGRHRAEFPLAEEALRLWDEAAGESEFELVKGGNLYFQTRDSELPILRSLVAEAYEAGLRNVQLLDADQVREILPAATGPGLTIITGLSGHGFTIGPGLGEIATDLSLDGHTEREIKEFRLSRFTDSPIHRPEMMI